MKIFEIDHQISIKHGDFIAPDDCIYIGTDDKIYRNNQEIRLKGEYSLNFPFVRILSHDRFLLVDSERDVDNKANAWIFDDEGSIKTKFYIGSPLKLLCTSSRIIASYSGASLYTSEKYSNNALAVFDYEGRCFFEYYRDVQKDKVMLFIENYAFLDKNEASIYFMPFGVQSRLSIVEFDLKDYSTNIVLDFSIDWQEHKEFLLPKAFTQKNGKWYFMTPDSQSAISRVFEMDSHMSIKEIGQCAYAPHPRGLPNGRFSVPAFTLNKFQRSCYIEV